MIALLTMKRAFCFIITILCTLPAFAKGFTLKGSIEGLPTGSVSLAYVNEAGDDTTINASVTGGAFTLAGTVPEPELVRLTVTEGWAYNVKFYLENTAIAMHLVKDDGDKTTITGSAAEVIYEKLKPGLSDFFEYVRQNEAAHHQTNAHAIQIADSVWNVQQHQWIESIRSNITTGAGSYAALYFIQWLLFKPDNYDDIFKVFMQLNPTVRQGPAGKKLLADFEHLHRTMAGQPAPEITGKDTAGLPVKLATYKGKVILLDFWASYCGPCRQENKRMLPVYEKYHAAGFEIVSLSLDNERRLWVQAILADGMPWPQASELRGGAGATGNTYDITDLPRNVLIDRTGKIYAKDLHGDDLVKAVEGLLGRGGSK